MLHYNSSRDLNAKAMDDIIDDCLRGEIEKDEEIAEYDYTTEEVMNPFLFAEKRKEIDGAKCNLSTTTETTIDWDYDDYETYCMLSG